MADRPPCPGRPPPARGSSHRVAALRPQWDPRRVRSRRRAKQLGIVTDRPCGLCGNVFTVLTETRAVRRGLAWINPLWDPDRYVYQLCSRCGAWQDVDAEAAS